MGPGLFGLTCILAWVAKSVYIPTCRRTLTSISCRRWLNRFVGLGWLGVWLGLTDPSGDLLFAGLSGLAPWMFSFLLIELLNAYSAPAVLPECSCAISTDFTALEPHHEEWTS